MSTGSVPEVSEELSLADLIRILIRRRKLVLGVFLGVVLAGIILTAATEPEYESVSSFLVLNEKDAVLALINSEAYAASVADAVELTEELGGGNRTLAAKALMERVQIRSGERGQPANLVTVQATAATSDEAASLANAYVTSLDVWRGFLVNVTYESQWEKYYEQAGKDPAKAESQLDNLTREMRYVQALDAAAPPDSPARPDWSLNLSVAAAVGTGGAMVAPFLVGAVLPKRAMELSSSREEGPRLEPEQSEQ